MIKKILLLSTFFLFVFALSWSLEPNSPRLISVNGEAEVNVVPDEVIIILGVETSNLILKAAKRQNDDAIKGIIAVAKKYGVDGKDIQTDYFTIEPKYDYNEESGSSRQKIVFVGYFVRKNISITLRDLSKYEDVLSGVLEAGANYLQGIQFHTTELRKYRDQARVMAIEAAKEKAELFAGRLGMKIGKPYSINEDYNGWYSWNNSWQDRMAGRMQMQNAVMNEGNYSGMNEPSTIAPGQISVSARVTVSFELE
jgi:hypothetical protein